MQGSPPKAEYYFHWAAVPLRGVGSTSRRPPNEKFHPLCFLCGESLLQWSEWTIEDKDTKIFLDFGMSFNESKKYYAEFLQPRTCNGLGDLIELGIAPDIQGIYRNDHLANEGRPLTEVPIIDGVFLSHAHADHCWHISLLHPDIPIHCGFTCKLMLKQPKRHLKEHTIRISIDIENVL